MEPQESFDTGSMSSTPGAPEAPGNGGAAQRAKDATAQAVKEAREKFQRAYERSSDAVTQAYDRAMDYSRENPRTATLVALGAGFGIGVLFAYGVAGGRRDRRFLPALASTLADAVLDVVGRR
jgi:ElaB/YqjD/DUF883 family membrane-anchored ribosome-binding protein